MNIILVHQKCLGLYRKCLGQSTVSWSVVSILVDQRDIGPSTVSCSNRNASVYQQKNTLVHQENLAPVRRYINIFIQQQSIMAHQESTKCISQLTEQYLRPSRVSCSNKRRESGSSRSILVDHTIQNILFHQKYLAPTASWSVHSTCSNRNALVNQQYQKSILVQQERSILLQQKYFDRSNHQKHLALSRASCANRIICSINPSKISESTRSVCWSIKSILLQQKYLGPSKISWSIRKVSWSMTSGVFLDGGVNSMSYISIATMNNP